MKQTLLAALLLVGVLGSASAVHAAGAYKWNWTLNDVFGNSYAFDIEPPGSGFNFLATAGSDRLPRFAGLGAGLAYDAGNIVVTGIVIDAVADLHETLDAINVSLSGKSNVGHTHITSNIFGLDSYVNDRIESNATTTAQRARVQTNGTGGYTWTFPIAYATSTLPVVSATPEDATASASTDIRIVSISNTSVTVQASRITTVLGLLSLNATPQIYVHLTAMRP